MGEYGYIYYLGIYKVLRGATRSTIYTTMIQNISGEVIPRFRYLIKQNLYLEHKDKIVPAFIEDITFHKKQSRLFPQREYYLISLVFQSKADFTYLKRRDHVKWYYSPKNICPTCISFMKCFDECAPTIKTKMGQLIL